MTEFLQVREYFSSQMSPGFEVRPHQGDHFPGPAAIAGTDQVPLASLATWAQAGSG